MTDTTTASTWATVGDAADLVRAKNAGPFWLTLDVFTADAVSYERVADPSVITADAVAAAYRVDPSRVLVHRIPSLGVVKVSLPRPVVQGSFLDRDMHSGQQAVQLAALPLGTMEARS